MRTVSVISKLTAVTSNVDGDVITLTSPSIVKMHMDRAEIASMKQVNHDLVITLHSGEIITVKNFYASSSTDASQLVLEDNQGALWWVQDTNGAFHFQHIDNIDALLTASETHHEGAAIWPWVLGGVGVAAGIGLAAGGGGGGGHSDHNNSNTGGGDTGGGNTGGGDTGGGNTGGGDTGGGNTGGGDTGGGDTGGGDTGGGDTGGGDTGGGNTGGGNTGGGDTGGGDTGGGDTGGGDTGGGDTGGGDTGGGNTGGGDTGGGNTGGGDTGGGDTGGGDTGGGDTGGGDTGGGDTGGGDTGGGDTGCGDTGGGDTGGGDTGGGDTGGGKCVAAPIIIDLTDSAKPGNPPVTSGVATNDSHLQVNGTSVANALITVYSNGNAIGQTTADSDGYWSVSPTNSPFSNGQYQITATATVDGVESDESATFVLVLDTIRPDAPDNLLVSDDGLHVTGTAEVGTTVTITSETGKILGTTVVTDSQGAFSIDLNAPQRNGEKLDAYATDSAGNTSLPGMVTAPDTTPPAAPILDHISADGTQLFGSAEQGSTVTVTDGHGHTVGTITVTNDNGSFIIDLNPAQIAGDLLSAIATDVAGNPSLPSTLVSPDLTPPNAPEDLAITDNGDTLTGTAEIGSLIIVTGPDHKEIGRGYTDETGSFSITLTPQQINGEILSVTATDASHNASDPTSIAAPDLTPPEQPVILSLTDEAGVLIGALTNDATPTLSGTAEAGATINIYDNSKNLVGTTQADVDGNWNCKIEAGLLLDGGHIFTAIAIDAAHNPSIASEPISVVIDTIPPAAPVIIQLNDAVSPIVSSIGDLGTTNDTKPQIVGSGESGTTVHISLNGHEIGTALVDSNGVWIYPFTSEQTDDTYTLTAVASDPAGNTSDISNTFTFTVDTTPPAAPEITSVYDDVGLYKGDIDPLKPITDDTLPTLNGTAEKGTVSVNVYEGTALLGSATVDSSSLEWHFTLTTPLDNNDHTLSVYAVDAAGNVSKTPATFMLTVDTLPPPVPTFTVTDDSSGTNVTLSSGQATKDNTPTLSGQGEIGSTITIYDGNSKLDSIVLTDSANWTYELPLGTGSHSLTLTATDAAGNVSDASPAFVLYVQDPADTGPAIVSIFDDVPNYIGNLGDNQLTNDPLPVINGIGTANSAITLYVDGFPVMLIPVGPNGQWSFQLATPLKDGQHAFYVEDGFGTKSPTFHVTVDITPPPISTLVVTDNTGALKGVITEGMITDETRPVISGTTEAGAQVVVYDGLLPIANLTADINGKWSFTPDASYATRLTHSLTVTTIDAAGNTSTSLLPMTYIVDTTRPTAPIIQSADDNVGSIRNPLSSGGATDDNRPVLHGHSEYSDATITLYDNGNLVTTVKTDTFGTWSYQPDTKLSDGPHSFTATVTNVIGATSAQSSAFALTVDTTPPAAPVIALASDGVTPIVGSLTNNNHPTLSGTGEPGATITIYNADTKALITTTQVNADNTWSVTLPTLTDATYHLNATATDAVGNSGNPSTSFTLTIDTQAPGAPSITSVYDDIGSKQGYLDLNQITDDNRPALTGKAEAGSTVSVFDNGKLIGQTKADATTGVWSLTPTTALADGSHALTVKATDGAGNTSIASSAFNIVVDTQAPNPPAIVTVMDNTLPQQGNVVDKGFTNERTPTISGTAEKNTSVEIFDNGKSLGIVTADDSGNWTLNLTAQLSEGAHTLTAKATDTAGNISGVSSNRTFTVDITPPNAPTNLDVNATGNSLTGSAEAGSKVTVISASGVVLGSGTADATGKFTVTLSPTQTNGEKLSAYATDAAGNQGGQSDVYAKFSGLPGAPIITAIIDNVGSIKGNIDNGKTTDDRMPTIQGTAQARANVNIYENGKLLAVVTASDGGSWQYQPGIALAEGTHTFTATATNSNGTGVASTAISIIVDITPPDAPSAAVSADGYTIGNLPGQPTEANATITVTLTGGAKVTATADGSGNWSATLPSRLVSGETLTVNATDAAGNTSQNTTVHAPTLSIAANDDIVNLGDLETSASVLTKQASGYGAQLINALGNTITVLADKVAKAEFVVDDNNTGSATVNAIATGTILSLLSSQLIVVQIFDTKLQAWTTIVDSSQGQFASLLTIGTSGISLHLDDLQAGKYRVLSYNTSVLAVGAYTGINVTLTETTPGLLTEKTPHQANLLLEAKDVAPIGTVVTSVKDAHGNAIAVDTSGADTSVAGKYGTLKINASGDYTYTLNATTTSSALGHAESFTYTITQGGKSSSANLVINLGNTASAISAVDDNVGLVYDTHVTAAAAATLPGSQTSYTVVSLGLGDVISVGLLKDMRNPTLLSVTEGTDRVITLQSAAGGVMIGATFDLYVYRLNVVTQQYEMFRSNTNWLTVPLLGGKSAATTLTLPGGEYLIVLNNSQGLNLLGGYTINYLSDYTYHVDSLSASTSGNVLSNDAGIAATGAHVTDVNNVSVASSGTTTITGQYGTLVIDANGKYTYTLNSGVSAGSISAPDSFIYTITAQDGTKATATLNIQPSAHALDAVNDISDTMTLNTAQVTTAAASVALTSTTLAKNTTHNESDALFTVASGTAMKAVSISFSVASNVAISSLSLKWTLYEDGNPVANNGVTKGSLTLTNKVNTLSLPGLELSEGHTYTLHLSMDMTSTQPGAITVTPSFIGTSYDLDNFLIAGAHSVTGNIYDGSDSAGAMDQLSGSHTSLTISGYNGSMATLTPLISGTTTSAISSLTSASINGHYGKLTINLDGSYSYTLNSNLHPADITSKEVFSYTLNDQNGHTDTATLTIDMNPTFTSTNQADVIIGSAYGDTLIYNLLNSTDATGGNNVDHWSNFSMTQGDKIDVHNLLVGWDGQSSSLGNYLTVTDTDKGTQISIDRDGSSGAKYSSTALLVLDDVHNIKLSDLVEQNHIVAG